MMDATLGYILCSQSPALFLAAAVLLLCYFARRRVHRARGILDLVLCIACAAAAVVLYFLGMGKGYFTIRDFYQIRTPGWVGMAVVAQPPFGWRYAPFWRRTAAALPRRRQSAPPMPRHTAMPKRSALPCSSVKRRKKRPMPPSWPMSAKRSTIR